jgi:uroporphyrinogen decarboxylase
MHKETMTSRQRVLRALNHQVPDRVPIDLGGSQSGLHKLAYQALLKHLGIEDEVSISDGVQQLARPCEELLERFHVDTRYVAAGPATELSGEIVARHRDGRVWHELTDEFGVAWAMPEDRPCYMTVSHHPLARGSLKDLAGYPFPKGDAPGRFQGLRDRAVELSGHTPYAVVSGIAGTIWETCWQLRGLEQWLADVLTRPEFCEALLDRALEFWLDFFRVFLDEVGDLVDVIMIGDDLAGQTGPLFRPDLYRRIVRPRHRRLVEYVRSRTGAKVCYHTCGSCAEYVPDLVEIGAHALSPIQIGAAAMDPAALKGRFGRQLVFWGGAIDAQHVLPSASPQTIRREVQRNLEVWKPGGGYIFANPDNLQPGIPAENIEALFDAAYEYAFYD